MEVTRSAFHMLFALSCSLRHRLNAFHLAAYKRTIASIKAREFQNSGVIKLSGRIPEKEISKFMMPFKIKIHGEKCQIIRDIDKAQPIVKLNAVEDGRFIRCEMDVVDPQVAMAVSNSEVPNPVLENLFVRNVEIVREVANHVEGDRRNGFSHKRLNLREILVRGDLQVLGLAQLFNLRVGSFRFIKST